MRKTLGILNILAGASILALLIWMLGDGFLRVKVQDPSSMVFLGLFLLVSAASFASGTFVLMGRHRNLTIWAAFNLIFAGIALYLLLPAAILALLGD